MKKTVLLLAFFTMIAISTNAEKANEVHLPSYKIIQNEELLPIKRMLDIRLTEAISEEDLERIGNRIMAGFQKTPDKTFINYYLPGQEIGAGAWGTTNFTPELNVKIWAMPASSNSTTDEVVHGREMVGTWNQSGIMASQMMIYSESGQLYLDVRFSDGSTIKSLVKEKEHHKGRMFKNPENSFGEFFVINKSGDLETWDEFGLIDTAKKD